MRIRRADESIPFDPGHRVPVVCVECGDEGPIDAVTKLCRRCREDDEVAKKTRRLEALKAAGMRRKG